MGADSFPSTSWTLVAQAKEKGTTGRDAVARFILLYSGPVTAYFRALFRENPDEAEEHASAFFEKKVWAGKLLLKAEPGHSRFRHYLKRCVHNYAISVRRAARPTIPIEDADAAVLQSDGGPWADVERSFHQEWVRGLLQRAVESTRETCVGKGQQMHFELFRRRFLADPEEYAPWATVATAVPEGDGTARDLTEKEAQRYAETAVRHFRHAILDELEEQTGSAEAAREELSTLFALFEET